MTTLNSSLREILAASNEPSHKSVTLIVVLFAVAFSTATTATEAAPPAEIDIDNTPLQLNGFATRKFFFFIDVYVGALYVEHKSTDPRQLLTIDQSRVMRFDMLRDVRGRRIVNAFYEGMQLNMSAEKIRLLEPEIKSVISMFDQVLREGETAILEYKPSRGTRIILAGREKGVIPGKDLFDAMLAIWIGEYPISEDFKDSILGREN